MADDLELDEPPAPIGDDPQPAAPTAAPARMYSADEFSAVIRKMYPTLGAATGDNKKLTAAILKVHPEFKDHVIDPMGGVDDASKVLGYDPTKTKMVARPYGEALPAAPQIPGAPEKVDTTSGYARLAKFGPSGSEPPHPLTEAATVLEPILDTPRTGAQRMIKGGTPLLQAAQGAWVRSLAKGTPEEARINAKYPPVPGAELAQGGADVIGGGMEAATLLLPEALAAAPVGTVAAIALGTAAAKGTEAAGQAMGASPAYTHLASEIAGLVAGIAGGHGVSSLQEGAIAGNEAFRAELSKPPGPLPDIAGENLSDAMMLDAAKSHAEGISDDQSLQNLLAFQDRKFQNGEIDKLSYGLAENYRLSQIAKKFKGGGAPIAATPFEAVDAFTQQDQAPPLALGPGPDPAQLGLQEVPPIDPTLGDSIDSFSRVPPVEAGAPPLALPPASSPDFIGADPNNPIDPNKYEVLDPSQPLVAQSEAPPPPLIQTLGEQLSSELTNQPPAALQPRPTAATGVKLKDRVEFKQRARSVAADAVSEMENMRHSKGRYNSDIDDPDGGYYTPPIAGSDWYWRVVGKDTQNPPTRDMITALMAAYRDSAGAIAGKDLSPEVIKAGMEATGHSTEGGFTRAYDKWAPEIDRAITNRATAMLGYERSWKERAAADAAAKESEGAGNEGSQPALPLEKPGGLPAEGGTLAPAVPPVGEPAGPPAPLSEAAPPWGNPQPKLRDLGQDHDLPEFLRNLQPEDAAGGHDEEGFSDAERIQQAKDLTENPDPTGEAGHLILNIGPSNKHGLKEWLAKHADEYGDEDWHQKATEAMEAGDSQTAWRISALASGRAMAAAGARGAVDREHEPLTMSPAEIAARRTKVLASTEKQLGYKLPKDTSVNPETGIIEFPENGGVNLKARFSDLTLGKSMLNDVLDQVDATSIIRVEDENGHLDEKFVSDHPEMRITSQMADQIVRDMPDAVKEAFDQTGLTPVQIGAHFRRAFRQAGQVLNMAKQWQDNHWDDILHLDPLTGSTAGPGAAGRLEFLPPERAKAITDYLNDKRKISNEDAEGILKDVMRLSPKKMAELGFDLPDGVDPESKQATAYLKNWLNRQQRLVQLGTQVDAIAADNGLDKALVAGSLGATDETVPGKIRETYLSLMRARLSFLISQTSTGFHVLASQGMRYGFGITEELFSSAAAAVSGDMEGAAQHLSFAKNLTTNVARPGKIPMGLIKRPWSDGIENLFEYSSELARGLDPNDTRKTLAAMSKESPENLHHMMATLTLGDPNPEIAGSSHVINPKVTNFLTAFMRFHAGMYRSMVSDAMIRTAIEMKGDDPNVVLSQEGGMTLKYGEDEAGRIFGAAAAQALNYTQASDPYPGTFPAWIGSVFEWSKYPELAAIMRMGVPFPRFTFGNVPRYVWDRVPGTIIADIARAKFPVFGKGRLGLGLEREQIGNVNIPHLEMERAGAEHDAAKTLGDLIQANEATKAAAQAFKAMEKKAGNAAGDLTGMQPELQQVREDLLAQIEKKNAAQSAYKLANNKANNLDGLISKQNAKLKQLQEIDAPNWKQAVARQTQGAMFLTAAIGMRAAQDDDTKWSDLRVKDPINGGTVDVDTKWASGLSQFLLPADVIVNFHRHTDWDVVKQTLDKEGWNYKGLVEGMKVGYSGKYTSGELAKEAAEAFFSLSPVIGGMSSFVDMTTGRSADGTSVLDAPFDVLATFIGQSLGAFTLPARQFGDLIGQFYEPESRSYTAEAPGKYGSIGKEIVQPIIQNVPGVRELITPKVNALTGQPNENPLGAFKPLGVSAKVIGKIEREMESIGLPYSEAVPKVTGDRDFDNTVSKAYAGMLKEYTDQLLAVPEYTGAHPDMRRDLFKQALGSIKQAALYQAGEAMGLTEEATHDKLESPKTKERRAMYERYMAELDKEIHPAGAGGAPESPEAPAAREDGPPQALNFGGSGVADAGGLGQRVESGGFSRPPAAL